jgi:nucleotide-binding universal stress UspA family protein
MESAMFKKILVPIDVDYPKTAAAVYQRAAALAKMNDAEVKLIGVMPGFGMPIVASYITEEMRKKATEKFKAALEAFITAHCSASVSYAVRTGKHWEEILNAAERWGADLIVVYHNHRRDVNEAFSSSCTRRVAEHANCSVLRLRQIGIE